MTRELIHARAQARRGLICRRMHESTTNRLVLLDELSQLDGRNISWSTVITIHNQYCQRVHSKHNDLWCDCKPLHSLGCGRLDCNQLDCNQCGGSIPICNIRTLNCQAVCERCYNRRKTA